MVNATRLRLTHCRTRIEHDTRDKPNAQLRIYSAPFSKHACVKPTFRLELDLYIAHGPIRTNAGTITHLV
jgi:hypothetical protein